MRPNAKHLGHIGTAPGDIQHGLSGRGNMPSFVQVGQVRSGAFDGLQRHDAQPRLLDLHAKFLRAMAVAGKAAALERRHDPRPDCPVQQVREPGVTLTNPQPQYAVEEHGPAGYGGRGDDSTWTHDTERFAKTLRPRGRGDQVVERTKEEYCVDRRVRHVQVPRVPHLGFDRQPVIASIRVELRNMRWQEVTRDDLVSQLG